MSFRVGAAKALGLWAFLTGAAGAAEDEDWPLAERLLERFAAGRYAEVAAIGGGILHEEPEHFELRQAVADSLLWTGRAWAATAHYRFLIQQAPAEFTPLAEVRLAHSLAWTGRIAEARPHYSAQLTGPFGHESRLGLAHALRWQGRQDLALPHYDRAIEEQPDEIEAVDGQLFAARAIRARSVFGAGGAADNTPVRARELTLSHTWRNSAQTRRYELETIAGREWETPQRLRQREFSVRIDDLDAPWAPRLELTQQLSPRRDFFAQLRLQLSPAPLYLHLARVNWGKDAFDTEALADGLNARRLGLSGKQPTALGELRGFLNHFAVSDGNRVINGDLRLTPWWRPWGAEIRPYAGVTGRQAARVDPRYWSPARYAEAYLGAEGEWERRDWTLFAFAQAGRIISDGATATWSGGVSAKRWIDPDWALVVKFNAQSNGRREGYRAQRAWLGLEKLW